MPDFNTADLCDAYGEALQVAQPVFNDYGGRLAFHGQISTLKVVEEFIPIKQTLQTAGESRVLVVDGSASMKVALLGDRLAEIGLNNGWAGIVINGCIRDSTNVADIAIGVKALNTNPRRPGLGNSGVRDLEVSFAGVVFKPGHYLYADRDGLVISATACEPPTG